MIRDTIYNIKPIIEINEDSFRDIIHDFIYCPIQFQLVGNLATLPEVINEIMITNLKEALTNASKYSGATQIEIKVEVKATYVRFYFHDNGKGCLNIKSGIGISGMKERIKSVEGMINFDGQNGFTIITVIPIQQINIFR